MKRPPFADADLERQLVALFYEVLFQPILKLIQPVTSQPIELKNATAASALRDALRSGRIQYTDGVFSGKFSAAISNALRGVGASFDARAKVYRLAPARVPIWIIGEATTFRSKAEAAHKAVLRELDKVQENLDVRIYNRPVDLAKTIQTVEDGWKETARQFELKPTLSPKGAETLRREWSETAKLPIKKFAAEEVRSLRAVVEENAQQGYRFDRLIDGVKARYSVSRSKAKFLARNETSIFMSKYRQERFLAAGVRRYTWATSHDARVRPALNLSPAERLHAGNHRVLNGKVFFFSSPPVVDPHTGRRANPGEDYNCRCVAIPLLEDDVSGA